MNGFQEKCATDRQMNRQKDQRTDSNSWNPAAR